MSEHDLQVGPTFHHKCESIEAHLSVVAAVALTRHIEARTGMSIKKFVKTTRGYREVVIAAGDQLITAADPLPAHVSQAIDAISVPEACAPTWPNSGISGREFSSSGSASVNQPAQPTVTFWTNRQEAPMVKHNHPDGPGGLRSPR